MKNILTFFQKTPEILPKEKLPKEIQKIAEQIKKEKKVKKLLYTMHTT